MSSLANEIQLPLLTHAVELRKFVDQFEYMSNSALGPPLPNPTFTLTRHQLTVVELGDK